METDELSAKHVKERISEIKNKQRIITYAIIAGVIVFILGYSVLSWASTSLWLASVGLNTMTSGFLIFFVAGWIWIYYQYQKLKIIKKFRTYLAIQRLQADQKEWELIEEIMSE